MEVVRVVQRIDIDRIRDEYEKIKDTVPWENGQTSINYRDCFNPASISPRNIGCGFSTVLLYSGWY